MRIWIRRTFPPPLAAFLMIPIWRLEHYLLRKCTRTLYGLKNSLPLPDFYDVSTICRHAATSSHPGGDISKIIFILQYLHQLFLLTIFLQPRISDSATWYSTHTCSTLRGSTLKKMFPYKNFYFKWGQFTCGAPERLTAFGARTFLVLSQQ
jgi:hypothetical protein